MKKLTIMRTSIDELAKTGVIVPDNSFIVRVVVIPNTTEKDNVIVFLREGGAEDIGDEFGKGIVTALPTIFAAIEELQEAFSAKQQLKWDELREKGESDAEPEK